jgi:DNA-binding CsgD family transcriptional regulator/tetratricopeptide (TPR) repeat protein
VLLLAGESGIGRSRLTAALVDELRRAGWTVAAGRAYAVEAGVPFALFTDAFLPLLSSLPAGALTTMARGAEAGLARLFPALGTRPAGADDEEGASRTQLFWSLARVLQGMSARAPVVAVLEDLHWSDASSLELLHFLARQLADDPVVFVVTVNEDERGRHPTLREVLQSLSSLGVVIRQHLAPLSREATGDLLRETFGVGPEVAGGFTRLLHERTGGNPLLIEAALTSLVESGRLRKEGGTWLGWEISVLEPPRSVREAILLRAGQLSEPAQRAAEAIAFIGSRARHDVVSEVSELAADLLAAALDELRGKRFITEDRPGRWPVYDLTHPLARDVLIGEVGLARQALVHRRVAEALERAYGADAGAHADELAYHFARAEAGGVSPRALPYLAVAGRRALARFADREAEAYLRPALEGLPEGDEADGERLGLLEDLGRALRRLGDVEGAIHLWDRGVALAARRGDPARYAALLRRIGLARFFTGAHGAALDAYDRALAARGTADARALGRVLVARGMCLQGLGRVEEAERDLREALALAEGSGEATLLARAHRALLSFHTWSGPPDVARQHGRAAIADAEASGDRALACTCHWAQAVLEGLAGRAAECAYHLREAERLNEEVGSPLLDLAIAEVQVEYAFGMGSWDTALALGERAIALGRSLNEQALLPRLLVWTGLVHLGRDAGERASAYLEEAWDLAGAGARADARDVHSVVPAHVGIAARHIALGEIDDAVRVARAGLAIVDRTGYRTWAGHRLLPVLAEAHLIARDLEGARAVGARLRAEAEALDDPLARAWADACDAVALWLGGAGPEGADALRGAAEKLEAIPFLPDALRVRRRLAACLADLGDRDGAVRELRRIHDGFVKLGAERELEKTRRALHELGARPPVRSAGAGAAGLTGRELQIVGLVAAGKSNKAIGRELGISARTVDTHLSNIFKKLEVDSRGELVEVARTLPRTS